MDLVFSEESLKWLKEKGFNDWEIEDAQKCINIAAKSILNNETAIRIPEGTTVKVAALAYAVLSNFDENMAQSKMITISQEIRDAYNEEIEIGQLEELHAKIRKVKLGKIYSDARKKSSVKKGSPTID
ncbi:MAG: hypothetical protein QW153_02240 [Candidatus Bilamarchaeaceae archaeon]